MRFAGFGFQVPEEKFIRVIIDSDAKNEADDQFALAHALLSPRMIHKGIIASHFRGEADSMAQSRAEIETVLEKMHVPSEGLVLNGAPHAMPNPQTAVPSEGAQRIVEEAMSDSPYPLYALFMGPLTDLASAILMEPRICKRMTAIWVGGGAYPEGGQEFNLQNDIAAANAVFASNMELWQIPKNVYEMMALSIAEIELRISPQGEIGRYLFDQLAEHALTPIPRASVFRTGESWVLGDNTAVGLLLYEHRFLFDWVPAPYITNEMNYVHNHRSRSIRVYRALDSRLILEDLYVKLELFAKRGEIYHAV